MYHTSHKNFMGEKRSQVEKVKKLYLKPLGKGCT